VGGSGVIVCRICFKVAKAYFEYAGGFTSLFENAETFDVSGGTSFSSATLMELLDLSDLSGTIISSVVESLRHVVDIFNHSGLSTSTDITNQTTWRWDGFMPERYDMDSEWYSG
jgi:hypothetical protein